MRITKAFLIGLSLLGMMGLAHSQASTEPGVHWPSHDLKDYELVEDSPPCIWDPVFEQIKARVAAATVYMNKPYTFDEGSVFNVEINSKKGMSRVNLMPKDIQSIGMYDKVVQHCSAYMQSATNPNEGMWLVYSIIYHKKTNKTFAVSMSFFGSDALYKKIIVPAGRGKYPACNESVAKDFAQELMQKDEDRKNTGLDIKNMGTFTEIPTPWNNWLNKKLCFGQAYTSQGMKGVMYVILPSGNDFYLQGNWCKGSTCTLREFTGR